MTDLTKTIQSRSDQLNSDDLIAGPVTIRVSGISLRAGDQPVAISYDGDNGKPFLPCKTMRRVLVAVWGADGNKYIGRKMTIYRDPDVTWAGQQVGGIRISHMEGIATSITLALAEKKGKKKPIVIKPLVVDIHDQVLKDGEIQAAQGIDALQAWFNGLDTEQKKAIKPDLDRLKSIANNVTTEPEEEGIL